ncbi:MULTISPECIES: integrase core domain-containing protein [unclassified Bradyrhizobium]
MVPVPCGRPAKSGDWRRYYNEERPHGAIGNRPPILLQNHVGATSPPT